MRIYHAFFVAGMLFAACLANAQSNLVLFISSPGDYIGQGQTYVTTNQADFTFSGTPSLITVDAFGYTFWIGGPGGSNLTVGLYTNSARYPFNGSQPGLDISGNGRGCNTDCGSFQVREIHTNTSGQVDRFWVTFTNHCECSMAPMMGDIRYNSQLAPAAPAPQTIHVPADYPTIQAAINAASVLTSDTVLVSPGVYNESVSFNGRPVRVSSTGGPSVTFIAAPSGASAVNFTEGETTNSVISGFTITNSSTGISLSGSSPTIESNVIVNCGTGINCNFASPIVRDNAITGCSGSAVYLGGAAAALIKGNILQDNGGGIGMNAAGSPTVINNLIQGNNGDAISGVNDSDVNVIQNIIAYNSGSALSFLVPSGGRGPLAVNNTMFGNIYGISVSGYDGSSEIINNIIIGDGAVNISYFNSSDVPVFRNNDIFSFNGNPYTGVLTNLAGISGNISANPFFVCLPSGDFHLLAGSPCLDAGTNGAPDLPGADFDGNPRILAGNTNGSAIVDMGAFEFNPAFPPSPCLYLTGPSNVVAVAAVGQNSAVVNYPAPDATPTATVTCLPASGSVFPAGTNTVSCTLVYGTNVLTGTFTVTVQVPPYITNQPTVISALANTNVTLSVGALGTSPMTYQWSFGSIPITSATNSTLTVSNVQSSNEGYYQVTLVNNVGTATSAPILLRVLPAAATVVSGPFPVTVSAGQPAVFSATVIGSAPLSMQWYKDGALLSGANSARLTISDAQASDMGSYQIAVSNSLGSMVSSGAALTVLPAPPAFVLQPMSTSAVAGASATFQSLAVGTDTGVDPIKYTWYFKNAKLAGQTSSDLSLSPVSPGNEGNYYAVAANSLGSATSAVAQLTVYLPPSIQTGLSNEIVDSGISIALSPSVTGTPPFAYNWFLNGSQLSNTAPSLELTNIQISQSGYYSVNITNQYGSASSTCRISVFGPPSRVIAWGDDSGGQTDVPTNLDNAVMVAGGDFHSLALRDDGSLVAWGYDGDGQTDVPTNTGPYVAIACGADHNLAITKNGSVVAWGLNDAGQCNIPPSVTSALALAAGDSDSLALLASGQVVAWGDDTYGQTNLPAALQPGGYWNYVNGQWIWVLFIPPPVKAIASGRTHNLALLYNGTVVGWGDNSFGQATPPAGLSNVVAIAAGYLHSVALLTNGTVVAWGDDTYGQTNVPAGLSNVVAIAAGDFDTLALRADGSIVGWGDDTFGQTDVPLTATKPVELSSGNYHGLALVPVRPILHPSMTPQGLQIKWDEPGILQWAPTPAGPFTDIPGWRQGYTNTDMSVPAKFFRWRR